MSKNHGPRIVTNGLKLCLDVSFLGRSYSGSGNTWYDLSGQHNDGSLVNGASYINNAMVFDGTNDRISVSPINIYQKSYSICAWIKRKSSTGIHGIMSDLQYGYWGFYIDTTSKLVMRHYYSESPYLGNQVNSLSVVDGEWTHVAGVFDTNSGMKVYIDGILDNSNTVTGASVLGNGRGPEHIGQYRNDAGNLETNVMNGSIASLQFYDRALSDSEIYQNYSSSKSKYIADIPYYDEGNNCVPYLNNWDNKTVLNMKQMGPYYNVTSHGYVDGPETYNFTLNNLPTHSQIRYKCVWHMLDSLDNETSYFYTSNSTNVLTERARFTKSGQSPPSFSIRNGVEYYWSGFGYNYTVNNAGYNNDGFIIFDTDYYDHSLSSFSARHIFGADQAQSDEAMYLSHVQVYLK